MSAHQPRPYYLRASFFIGCIAATAAVLTGVFASVAIGGVEGSITAQLIGIGACAAYALVVSLILLMLISVTIGLRVSEEAEAAGLDVSTHGESVE